MPEAEPGLPPIRMDLTPSLVFGSCSLPSNISERHCETKSSISVSVWITDWSSAWDHKRKKTNGTASCQYSMPQFTNMIPTLTLEKISLRDHTGQMTKHYIYLVVFT